MNKKIYFFSSCKTLDHIVYFSYGRVVLQKTSRHLQRLQNFRPYHIFLAMEKRSYKKHHNVYVELQEYCQRNIPLGLHQLPGERTLAAILGTSRMTLRKALEQAMLDGILIRRNKGLFIHPSRINACNLGKIVFVAAGRNGELILKALDRLYTKIYESLNQIGADISLCLTSDDQTFEELELQCRDADIILLAIPKNGNYTTADQIKFWQGMAHKHKIITLSDPYLDAFPNYIALDNYAVGNIAAEALYIAGCRRPGVVLETDDNIIFRKRTNGFCDFFKSLEIAVVKSDLFDRTEHLADFKRCMVNQLAAAGCDGIFAVTDEHLDFAAYDLLKSGIVPDKINLISVNGCGDVLKSLKPIACVNHATDEVAVAVLDFLKHLASDPDLPNYRLLIKPKLNINETLRLSNKQKEMLGL